MNFPIQSHAQQELCSKACSVAQFMLQSEWEEFCKAPCQSSAIITSREYWWECSSIHESPSCFLSWIVCGDRVPRILLCMCVPERWPTLQQLVTLYCSVATVSSLFSWTLSLVDSPVFLWNMWDHLEYKTWTDFFIKLKASPVLKWLLLQSAWSIVC